MDKYCYPSNFVDSIKNEKFLLRLKRVTTMMPPPSCYLNRYNHTFDVINVAELIINSLNAKDDSFVFLKEACLIHDIGHCCFAHEMEVVLNNFIAKRLGIDPNEVGFSHAVNGALVLALSAYPTSKQSTFSKLNIFKNQSYKDFVDIIVDGMVKHSINDTIVNGVYASFVSKYYNIKTGHSLDISTTPKHLSGFYLRLADDIATKNSDVLDIIQHYYGNAIIKDVLLGEEYHYKIADNYVKKVKQLFDNNVSIGSVLPLIPEYCYEKKLLNLSYHYPYKENITNQISSLTMTLLEKLYLNPYLIKKLYNSSRSFAFIKYVFEHSYSKYYKKDIKISISSIKKLILEYESTKSNRSINVYKDYICAIAYEISNFTDDELLKLFISNIDIYDESEKEIINQLLTLYGL